MKTKEATYIAEGKGKSEGNNPNAIQVHKYTVYMHVCKCILCHKYKSLITLVTAALQEVSQPCDTIFYELRHRVK